MVVSGSWDILRAGVKRGWFVVFATRFGWRGEGGFGVHMQKVQTDVGGLGEVVCRAEDYYQPCTPDLLADTAPQRFGGRLSGRRW